MARGKCEKVGDKEFCYTDAEPCCSTGNKYTEHNKAEVDSWDKYFQTQKVKVKGMNTKHFKSIAKAGEHHHIICVSAVGKFRSLPLVAQYTAATTWCVNDKANLIGLPLWSQNLLHYCHFAAHKPSVKSQKTTHGDISFTSVGVAPPPFESLPMHDQDHGRYITEVNDDLAEIAGDLTVVEECQDPEKTLKDELDGVVETYSLQLVENARRGPGTHGAWELGMLKPESMWYLNFTMCRNPAKRTHPMAGKGDYYDKMLKDHEAFWRFGNPSTAV